MWQGFDHKKPNTRIPQDARHLTRILRIAEHILEPRKSRGEGRLRERLHVHGLCELTRPKEPRVAKKQTKHDVAKRLSKVVNALEEARLAKTDTLCQESWPPSQRKFAHKQRSALAAHWKLDTRLTEKNLAHVAA